jgi:Plavaka transposase
VYSFPVYCLANVLSKVADKLGLSYRSAKELNDIIDELPGRPSFVCQDLAIGGETLHFYHRDILQCIRALYGDPEFARHLAFTPERHYTDPERTCRIYSDMHTGEWWWAVQVRMR